MLSWRTEGLGSLSLNRVVKERLLGRSDISRDPTDEKEVDSHIRDTSPELFNKDTEHREDQT